MTDLLHVSRKAKPRSSARLRFSFAAAFCAAALLGGGALFASPPPILGANVDLSLMDADERSKVLDRLAGAGVSSIRMQLDWNRVEPEPGTFQWTDFDDAVNAAAARGLEVVLVLGPCAEWAVNPAWEVPREQRCSSVPQSQDAWRAYVKAAVSHFRNRVRFWQVRRQPTARNFRGARREYTTLLESAAQAARAIDPTVKILVPEGGNLDIAAADLFIQSGNCQFADVLGVYAPSSLSLLPLPWAVLTQEVLGRCDPERRRPIWLLGGEETIPPAAWQAHYLMAWAFGAERCYLPPDAIDQEWTRPLANLSYKGFLAPGPGVWALVFDDATGGSKVALWSAAERELPAEAICPVLPDDDDADDTPPIPPEAENAPNETVSETPPAIRVGSRPLWMSGVDCADRLRPGSPTRADVLASREGLDFGAVPVVYMDLALPELPEFGLYNRKLRGLRGGANIEEARSGRTCLRTSMTYRRGEEEQDNPWMYFDVDDRWLYFDRGATRLALTVECEGSFRGAKKLGLNIVFDSTTGYRFTPWQWVDSGYGWRRYRFEISDASFANRDGYDFRINTKGSKQDLYVCSVTVEKLPAEASASDSDSPESESGDAGASAGEDQTTTTAP